MKKTTVFIIVTLLVSWLAAGIFHLLVKDASSGTLFFNFFGMLYMLFPALTAILLQKYWNKEPIAKSLMLSFRINWSFLIALVTPLIIVLLSLGINLLFPNIYFTSTGEGVIERYSNSMPAETLDIMRKQMENISFGKMLLLTIIPGFLAACTVNGLFALGEELGWRGYMLHHLKDWSFMKTSVFTGIIWGVWHFPLILMGHNYPNEPIIGVFFMIIFCILLSPIMTYIVIKSKSVLTAALFHGAINAFAGFPIIFLVGGNDITNGVTGIAGFISMIIITFAFFLFDKYITKEKIFTKTISESIQSNDQVL